MTPDSELVVIIILNLNKKEDILKCLESVFKLNYSPFEVVVVDNGSIDGSVEAISKAFPSIHLVTSINNLGAAGGRNLGIQYADKNFNHKYLFFLDNDTLVEDSTLTKLIEALKDDQEAGFAFPKAYREFPSDIIMSIGIYVNLYTGSIYDIGAGEIDRGQYNQLRYVSACGGFGFLAKRKVFSQIGLFDNIFNPYGWEEVDLSLRARGRGFKILYVPNALIYHKGGKASRGPLPEYEKYKVRNLFILMRRHTSSLQWICFVLFIPLKAFSLLIARLSHGDLRVVLAQFRGFFEGFIKRS